MGLWRIGLGLALACVVVAACGDTVVETITTDGGVRWLPSPATLSDAWSPPVDAGADGVDGSVDLQDFQVPGTQIGDVDASGYLGASVCSGCHSSLNGTFPDMNASPHDTWSGSLMANSGRDPLFFAQLANANQDVPGVGTYCLRCHLPMSVPTGHVADWTGKSIGGHDLDGVSCLFCHTLVDPRTTDPSAVSPNDVKTLASLVSAPKHFGNAQFVIDPQWLRRGPYEDAGPPHPFAVGRNFLQDSALCGTCHDVGNPAVSKLSNGTYGYNLQHQPAPDPDPRAQFPLERTYTEWSLSAFPAEGTTCQSCHMPRTSSKGCSFAPVRADLALHEFAGASAWVLDIISSYWGSSVDQKALARGRTNAIDMLAEAASLEVKQQGSTLVARVTNLSGHKLPTGHIEGRRVFVNVKMLDAGQNLLAEYGRWDASTGDLDESTTTVFEMHIGLSAAAAKLTGLPAGRTTHMSLADVIVKDNRIPPRGFTNSNYASAGAGAVDATYADGQNWADVAFSIPLKTTTAIVTLAYQTVTHEYVSALAKGNTTDAWGTSLMTLWQQSGKDAPISMASKTLAVN